MSTTLTPMQVDGRIETFSGVRFDIIHPKADDIRLIDIAHSLSNQCRYSGHTRVFYSVAQHCVIMSNLAKPEDALSALMHDAAEAYIGDMAYPIKHLFPLFIEIEERLQEVISDKFGYQNPMPDYLKEYDRQISGNEAQALMHSKGKWWNGGGGYDGIEGLNIAPLTPEQARELFLRRYEELRKES